MESIQSALVEFIEINVPLEKIFLQIFFVTKSIHLFSLLTRGIDWQSSCMMDVFPCKVHEEPKRIYIVEGSLVQEGLCFYTQFVKW